ncbi:hypothetical protein [Sporolactobacillus terrae]|uniref:hypothetical protein n=1 Tax=Sporolactobacillus terrae TaxID=269673 RepID=UPI001119C121|nr:hypothetical protein [Sporolactobacillus terrae]
MKFGYGALERAKGRIIDEFQQLHENGKLPEEISGNLLMKLSILSVKQHRAIDKKEFDHILFHNAKERLRDVQFTQMMLGMFTPKELQKMFPITKTYDGGKYCTKDYFSTRQYIDALPQDEPLRERINEFLMEYRNPDIEFFMVDSMMALSDCMKEDTGQSLGEQWAEEVRLQTVNIHEGTNGQKYMIDKNGRSKPVTEKKKRPGYLKLVK